ncbi:MAG: EAL domain-containing protein [Woeseiaceae bacterium]
MRVPVLPTTMKHGVGKRILQLILIAATIPALITACLAYYEINRSTKQDAATQLRGSAKAYGVELISRLERASASLEQLADERTRATPQALATHSYLLEEFEALSLQSANGSKQLLYGATQAPLSSTKLNRDFLETNRAQFIVDGAGQSLRLLLVMPVAAVDQPESMLVARLRADSFWEPLENRLYATGLCVYGVGGVQLHCTVSNGPFPTVIDKSYLAADRGLFDWNSKDAEAQVATVWQLFLDGGFAAPPLDIIAYQPKSHALRSGADFGRVFWPALVLIIVLVGALTLKMLGHSLTPLQQLILAARQLTAGNLAARVRIRTGDEFESLADAFNNMAGRVGAQISTLEAMSEIDRLILSNVRLEDIAENILGHVRDLTGAEVVAMVARKKETPYEARMMSFFREELFHDDVLLPTEVGNQWYEPRQVVLDEVSEDLAPYKERFAAFGQNYVMLFPVVLDDDLKGLLLVGSRRSIDARNQNLKSCIDLAGRLAVALSSVAREEALYRKAHYDDLTGLPNRQLLKDRLQQRLLQARREQQSGALLFLDLDRFKQINDVYGHSVGDIVLAQAAERIVNEVRDADTVARLGGDEFVVVLSNVAGGARVRATANRLLARLSESFSAGGADHFIAASIGIVVYPDDGDSAETLLKNADSAMYRAKEAGRGRFEFFSASRNAESQRKISLERDLRVAFHNEELELHYQPQFDLSTGTISGAEALLRWNHPEEGEISPTEFVPLAETSSLIVDIGRWVVRQSCRDLVTLLSQGLHPGPVSINVSAMQLRDGGFVTDVLSALHDHDVHPGYVQLEVTETTVAENKDTAIGILNALRAHGVRVAIDDFGTGYSSLSYLQQMPFDVIKIDMSFVKLIGAGDASDNICRTIIRMAHELGKEVIAEGVETEEQKRFLTANECDFGQGYIYAKPMSPGAFLAFIRKQDFHTQRRKALEIAN